jgi:hypothetical protein
MGISVSALKRELFELAEARGIRDPLTGCTPISERALTGLLCFYAQREAVSWERVPLYDVDSLKTKGFAADIVARGGSFLGEYILQHRDQSEERIWGGMPADLLYVSGDGVSVVIFENKIGSEIGYEPTPESNQLARQLEYLISLRRGSAQNVSLFLVSARSMFALEWYRPEFSGALKHDGRYLKASGYLVMWEDVFDAIAA